jgi:hypothetical protein
MRLALLLAMLSCIACVDGKTPDCTSIDSGCYPSEAAPPPPSDAMPEVAPSDAPSEATAADASTG